ncbi:hypothetical protein DPMN_160022 [Dreissena polymorpha]|uniref:Uncharacterized protein n=1 Tax=Dreissena polymorpha TaxID=45954 RepID=A0A9D4EPC8_DREPO|nr:hypothetical protein DPMN_160022 [Dreissena polymorpha]
MYVCFLDGRQAFDNVWHAGRLLWKCNIDPTSLIAIEELYMNAKSFCSFPWKTLPGGSGFARYPPGK